MKVWTKVTFVHWHELEGTRGTVYIDNPLRVRIDAGEEWAWQIISATEEDVQPTHSTLSTMSEAVEHAYNLHKENLQEQEEAHEKSSKYRHTPLFPESLWERSIRMIPIVVGILAIVGIALFLGRVWRDTDKPERIQKIRENVEKLNKLDNDNIPDFEKIIEVKKQIQQRKIERQKTLNEIEKLTK